MSRPSSSSAALVAGFAAIAAAVVLPGGASNGAAGQAPAARQHLVAFDGYMTRRGTLEATRVVELDPTTFRRLPDRELRLGDAALSRVLGPDGRTLAIGGANFGEIVLVDLARFTRTGVVRVARPTRDESFEVDVVHWPRPRRLLALVSRARSAHSVGVPPRLVLVDPLQRKVLRAIRLGGTVEAWARAPGGRAVLLLAPAGRIGAARIVVASPGGDIRAVTLTRILAGFRPRADRPYGIVRSPALVAAGGRAIVVDAFQRAASVDLRTLAVSYHAIPRLMRQHLPLAPASETGSAGPMLAFSRQASRIGRGRLIVTGRDEYPARGGKARRVTRAASIVDARQWRVTHVFRGVARLQPAHGLLFGSGESRAARTIGPPLAVFRPDGALVYRKDHPNLWWEIVAGRLIAGRPDGSALTELDPHTGETIRPLHDRATVWCCDVFAWTPPAAGR